MGPEYMGRYMAWAQGPQAATPNWVLGFGSGFGIDFFENNDNGNGNGNFDRYTFFCKKTLYRPMHSGPLWLFPILVDFRLNNGSEGSDGRLENKNSQDNSQAWS